MDLTQHILKMKNYNAGLNFVQHEDEEEYESHHTDGEVDDKEIVTNEILSVANAIDEEEVVVAGVVDDGKVSYDICGKRSIHKKNNK